MKKKNYETSIYSHFVLIITKNKLLSRNLLSKGFFRYNQYSYIKTLRNRESLKTLIKQINCDIDNPIIIKMNEKNIQLNLQLKIFIQKNQINEKFVIL
jgi:hypothetical protein